MKVRISRMGFFFPFNLSSFKNYANIKCVPTEGKILVEDIVRLGSSKEDADTVDARQS